jgi:integrase
VTIVEPLERALTAQRQWLLTTQHPGLASGLIFPASPYHATGGSTRRQVDDLSWFRCPTLFNVPLRKLVAAAGIPEISMHSLRRTFENLQRQAGVDQLVRRATAGWRSEDVQAIYTTVDRTERDKAAAAVVQLVTEEAG